jgi:hypothetical protein
MKALLFTVVKLSRVHGSFALDIINTKRNIFPAHEGFQILAAVIMKG